RLGCNLASAEWENLFRDLRGEHIHVWRDEDDGYSILFANDNPRISRALEQLAAGEIGCDAHIEPEVSEADDGILFTARGDNAFLFVQLFLSLEAGEG
ncbi:MAG: hypothetical protein QGF91_06545, partial [Gammaproteobacteria bacterium]|nr:hypothetical protein [Gammaproteobacteria bacterium]